MSKRPMRFAVNYSVMNTHRGMRCMEKTDMNTLMATPGKPRKQVMLRWLTFLLLLLGSSGAWAGCSGGGAAYTITMPSPIVVPRDTPDNTQITPWVAYPNVTPYSCSSSNTADAFGSAVKPAGLVALPTTWTSGGLTYTLWDTGVPGVGLALQFSSYFGVGCGSRMSNPMAITPAGGQPAGSPAENAPQAGWSGGSCMGIYGSSVSGGQVKATFVKIGPITAGTTRGGLILNMSGYTTNYYSHNFGLVASGSTFSMSTAAIAMAGCTTPDVLVPMGTHSSSEMGSVGATTAAVNVTINVNGCPAGMNTINYRVDPTTTVVNSAQSVVALDSSSSAAGVGVQLLNSAGTAALPLSTYQTSSGYNKTTGGSFTIPLKARFYRTGAITPGTAKTSMTFTMQYL
jgi:major type 1 subunit fimbrin (pilin)